MCPCLIPLVGACPHPEGQRVGLQPPVEGPTTRLGLRGAGGPSSCGSPPSRGARPGPRGLCMVARSPARPDRAVTVSLVLGACQSLERFPPRSPRSSLVALACVCLPPCSHVCARRAGVGETEELRCLEARELVPPPWVCPGSDGRRPFLGGPKLAVQ